jgi:hypothetical protein
LMAEWINIPRELAEWLEGHQTRFSAVQGVGSDDPTGAAMVRRQPNPYFTILKYRSGPYRIVFIFCHISY